MAGGRPSKLAEKATIEHAGKLCRMFGATDAQLAEFFGITILRLALWAWDHEDFYAAITPTVEERSRYAQRVQSEREKRNRRNRAARRNSPSLSIENSMRSRMYSALKGRTSGKCLHRLGYSIEDLLAHLSTRFADGMTWDNYGKWHVDHIRPCASFDQSDELQFRECWALANLQPLWASDNIRKGAKHGGS